MTMQEQVKVEKQSIHESNDDIHKGNVLRKGYDEQNSYNAEMLKELHEMSESLRKEVGKAQGEIDILEKIFKKAPLQKTTTGKSLKSRRKKENRKKVRKQRQKRLKNVCSSFVKFIFGEENFKRCFPDGKIEEPSKVELTEENIKGKELVGKSKKNCKAIINFLVDKKVFNENCKLRMMELFQLEVKSEEEDKADNDSESEESEQGGSDMEFEEGEQEADGNIESEEGEQKADSNTESEEGEQEADNDNQSKESEQEADSYNSKSEKENKKAGDVSQSEGKEEDQDEEQ